ncbi:lysophospholipid acyltransferase family protein [uncultured Abyssibacter sp.]|uniref:lysophospholipid acyltransferase family protein n=1 Tax=uncultured Abyssibacter sp. TaxID=2320202 RepID=UPI0032B22188
MNTRSEVSGLGAWVAPVGVSLNRAWRIFGTGVAFSAFGLGGMCVGLFVFPLVVLLTRDRERIHHRMQFVIHCVMRLFVELMRTLRLMTYSIEGADKLREPGQILIANHPTLIDVVMVLSQVPRTSCLVKDSLFRNPFTAGPVRSAGYVPNVDSARLVDRCAEVLGAGDSLIIFPEGTRTRPGEPVRLQRGTANIALRARKPLRPIIIDCQPSTLTKGLPWYSVPSRRFHITLRVGDPIDIEPFLDPESSRAISARRLTEYLEAFLEKNRHAHRED